jgi:hypothetical protein
MFYLYKGPGGAPNTSIYTVTLKLYIDCEATSSSQLITSAPFSVFDRLTGAQVGTAVNAPMVNEQMLSFDPASNPCIGNPPKDVCYRLRWFSTDFTLPVNANGYVIAFQNCCRIDGIVNLVQPSNTVGSTYMCEIPGTSVGAEAYVNNSPQYKTNDATAICANSAFTYSFHADEVDGDSLSYQLCFGFVGSSSGGGGTAIAKPPPYGSLNYASPYDGDVPLGGLCTINPVTGLITGIAPSIIGQYVLTACTYEYRKGVLINIHRKDIHVAVSDCIPLTANLKPDYSYCDDYLVNFHNEQLNPSGSQYIWDYGDGSKVDTTNDPYGNIVHQYTKAATFKILMKVILAGGQCRDSIMSNAHVYPGFYPGFDKIGSCILFPVQFKDSTKAKFGVPDKWSWSFGDETTLADSSHLSTPNWKYTSPGNKTVQLIVGSSVGCLDTVSTTILVTDKPPLDLGFKDTLICTTDTLRLMGNGPGTYKWGPNYNLLNPLDSKPYVYPKTTTLYKVELNESGCFNNDSVLVRVVDEVTMTAGPDTLICAGDTAMLTINSNGTGHIWSPASSILNPLKKFPLVHPNTTTTYKVRATIGKCFLDDEIVVTTVPYPYSFAGNDTSICFEDTAQFKGEIIGSRVVWNPTSFLSNPFNKNTEAFPSKTTEYSLYVYDTLGCPKPGISNITVNVSPKLTANAGRDTVVVRNQPLQLNGSNGPFYQWSPSLYLNNPSIANPIATPQDNVTYILKVYSVAGCYSLDTMKVKVFKTGPDIFVPNAFVPNGTNRILRPIPVGLAKLTYFRVYNRWGQLVYQTSASGQGWDGYLSGQPQSTGAYVWMASGVDYMGNTIDRRGISLLVR